MKGVVAAAVSTLVVLITAASGRYVCPPNVQSFVSQNENLLPTANIASTSEYAGNPAINFIDSGNTWCNSNSMLNFIGQYVELTFTEPVVIVMLMSSGQVSSFVNNFTISYSMSTSGEDFQTYGLLKDEQDFIVRSIETDDANFVLGDELVVRRVRFVINNGTVEDEILPIVCWRMRLFGCTQQQAQEVGEEVEASTTPFSETTSTSTSPGETTGTPAVICTNVDQEMKLSPGDDMLLLIVVPSAIGLVIIVAIIVAVLVCLCCMRSTNEEKSHRSVTIETVSSQKTRDLENGITTSSSSNFHYDNPRFLCYDVPRSIGRQNSVAESISTVGSHAEIKNPAYVTKKSLQALDLNTYHLPPDESNDYEDVPSPTELDKRTVTNTQSNSVAVSPPPPILTDPPKISGKIGDYVKHPDSIDANYSKVNKMKSVQKDEMERDYASPPPEFTSHSRDYASPPRDYSTPPVINDHYISSKDANAELVQEIDRLAKDLESSRAIVRQW